MASFHTHPLASYGIISDTSIGQEYVLEESDGTNGAKLVGKG